MERKQVVVLGGGFAGISAASKLDQANRIDVTLVTPFDGFFNFKIASLRAIAKGGDWVEKSLIPIDQVVRSGEIIQSKAVGVDSKTKTVKLANGRELKYDALIIATGSRNFSPADVPVSVTSKAGVKAIHAATKERIARSKSVVIVGAGSVGIELASEIREVHPNTRITIVSRSSRILPEKGAVLRESGIKALEDDLRKLRVDIILDDEISSHPLPVDLHEASPIVDTPGGVTLKSGKRIDSDLLLFAVGTKLNTDFLPSEWLDSTTHEVIVDEKTLQLKADPYIFAVGDIAKLPYVKRGYFAGEDAKVAVKNVIQVLTGKKPTNTISRFNATFINLGSNGGRGLMAYFTAGPMITTMLKSKDLFVHHTWKTVAPDHKVPTAETAH